MKNNILKLMLLSAVLGFAQIPNVHALCPAGSGASNCSLFGRSYRSAELSKLKVESYQALGSLEVSDFLAGALNQYQDEYLKDVPNSENLTTQEKVSYFYLWLSDQEQE